VTCARHAPAHVLTMPRGRSDLHSTRARTWHHWMLRALLRTGVNGGMHTIKLPYISVCARTPSAVVA